MGSVDANLAGWIDPRSPEALVAPLISMFIYSDMVDQFNDDTVNVAGTQWKLRISPRLGMSFPVTEKDKFFFNYGHFSQWPRYAYVYPQLQAQSATEIQLLFKLVILII